MAKKILFFLKEYDSYSLIFSEYVAMFVGQGFESRVFDFTKARASQNKLAYIFSIIKEIKKFQPDVVYIGDELFSKNVFLITFVKKLFFLKYKILALVASQYIPKNTFINSIKLHFLLHNIGILFCRNKEEFRKIKKLDAFKKYPGLTQIYLGVPVKFFYKVKQSRKKICDTILAFKDTYFALKGKYVLGFAGRIVPEKGLLLLLECLKKLPDVFVLLFVDRASSHHLNYYEKVNDFIQSNNLSKRVIKIDSLDNNDIKYLYNVSDVMVMPTTAKYDGFLELFGSVIAESMLCQTLVIGSDNGSIPEVIDNPNFIFKQNDIKDMLRVIHFVYRLNRKQKKAVLDNNYQKALQYYSATSFVNTIIKAIHSVI